MPLRVLQAGTELRYNLAACLETDEAALKAVGDVPGSFAYQLAVDPDEEAEAEGGDGSMATAAVAAQVFT